VCILARDCREFEDELEVVASSYWRSKASDKDNALPRIFFARAEYSANKETFAQYSLTGVPQLVYFAPTTGRPHPPGKIAAGAKYAGEMDAENAAGFVREKTE
jgi:hypothetical protein